MKSLLSRAIKLAYDNPGPVREALLPVLAKTAGKIPPQFLANIKKKKEEAKDNKDKDGKKSKGDSKEDFFAKMEAGRKKKQKKK